MMGLGRSTIWVASSLSLFWRSGRWSGAQLKIVHR